MGWVGEAYTGNGKIVFCLQVDGSKNEEAFKQKGL